MSFPKLTIGREPNRNPNQKTRTFSTRLLGYLAADSLWEASPPNDVVRPVWIAYFGTELESQPFTANFRAGRKAIAEGTTLQVPRKAPFRWTVQKVPHGVATVVYLPELFHLEPVVLVVEEVRFVFAPPEWWLVEQARELEPEFGEDAHEVAQAALFCAYLDRRTPLPLVHDLRFHLQLYRAALASDWVYGASGWTEAVLRVRGAEACGLTAPVAVSVGSDELSEFLIEQTFLYHQEEIRRGTTRITAGGRLLSYPVAAPAQLRLDFAVA